MSEEHLETARRYYEDGFNAFMRGDLSSEAFAELHDPEIEMRRHERTYPDTPQPSGRLRVDRVQRTLSGGVRGPCGRAT